MEGARRRRFRVLAAVAALCLVAAPAAQADTFVVTENDTDPEPGACDSHCTMREAVIAANENPGADTVSVPMTGSVTLRRTGTGEDQALDGDLDVTSGPLTVVHRGRGRPNIEAWHKMRDRVFDVEGARVRFQNVQISFGEARPDDGGGNGGGINVGPGADVTVDRSWIYADKAPEGSGGGIYVDRGSELRVVGTAINSDARDGGGGIAAAPGSRVEIVRGFFGKCTAERGGAILADGDVTVRSTLIGFCGAITRRSTTMRGGGVYVGDQGSLDVENSTLTQNRARIDGGAIYGEPGADVSINAATIARNTADADGDSSGGGGGIFAAGEARAFEVANTIVALNHAGTSRNDCAADSPTAVESGGANLLTTFAGGCGFSAQRDLLSSEPGLRAASGRSRTIPLLPGSPAIDAAGPTAPERDQRGRRRDERPDIGAYEFGAGR